MVHQKHKGLRHKTRYRYKKSVREKGMPTVNTMLREYKPGDKVHIEINSAVHSGMPYRRFIGKVGTIVGKRGNCYVVEVMNINALRTIIVHPAHIKLQKLAIVKVKA